MITRIRTSHLFAASLLALVFFLPGVSHAATGTDGTSCLYTILGVCYDSSMTSHGTATYGSAADASATPDLSNAKIYGCDRSQTKIPNIGTFAATASTYVPVYDDAVTINTGYLVYKACVLDALAAEIKTASTAKIALDTITYIAKGNTGIATPVQNIGSSFVVPSIPLYRDQKLARNNAELYKDYNTNQLNPNVRQDVIAASQRQDQAQENGYQQTLSADELAQQKSFQSGNFASGGLSMLWKMATNPTNSALFAYFDWKNGIQNPSNAQVAADANTQLIIDQGYQPNESVLRLPTANPNQTQDIYLRSTPGDVMAKALAQAAGSGFDQQKNAQSLDQLVLGTYSGLQERIISGGGLSEVAQPQPGGNGLSYLDQMFQSIMQLIQGNGSGGSGSTPSTAGGSALTQLTAALAQEQQYLSYQQQVQAYLGAQTDKLSAAQNACWITLANAVSLMAGGTSYSVATTTTNATNANNSLVVPINTVIQQDIDHSTTTIAVLQTMIVSTASSTSATSNAAIIAQLAALSANHTLHTATDIANAKQGVTDIQTTVGARVDATIATWKQGSGWCNASSTAVVQSWLNVWKN